MKQRRPKMMSLVIGKSGKYELHHRWVVAAFEDGMEAIAWCEKCREYGTWMAKMAKESDREKARYDTAQWDDPNVSAEEQAEDRTKSQFHWALEGSPGQMEEWEEEFEKEFPGGEWWYFYKRETALLLNPYDDQVFSSLYETEIEYEVIRVVLDPKEPYYP